MDVGAIVEHETLGRGMISGVYGADGTLTYDVTFDDEAIERVDRSSLTLIQAADVGPR